MNRFAGYVILMLATVACTQSNEKKNDNIFAPGVSFGIIEGKKMQEASGLAASISNPGMLWTHNDSGNDAEIFLIDKTGKLKSTVSLPDLKNRDWEDIVAGPGPEENKSYIYIGEIGDNNAVYAHKFVYRIEEPTLTKDADTVLHAADAITFRLPDGARDTEAMMIDPQTKDLYIFSKREANVNLYKLPYPQSTTETITAERIVKNLPFTLIVAADMSKDGSEILIKNYNNVYYWKREKGETIEAVIRRTPAVLPYAAEPQGESITFDREGTGYYTLSEQKKKALQNLYFYKRK
jgi:hypothetical protein